MTMTDRPTGRAPRPVSANRLPIATLVVGLALVLGAAVVWRATGDDTSVPYDDPQSAGLLTLCSGGEAVTGGSVDDRVAEVVLGATALPADVDQQGAVATLFAYQPRAGIAPSEFSGSPLTAASLFAEPSQPAARVTDGVWSVGDIVSAYPAELDGFVQLRLYLGTPEAGSLTDRPYDTADLRVDGDSWEVVRGGHASCADADSALVP